MKLQNFFSNEYQVNTADNKQTKHVTPKISMPHLPLSYMTGCLQCFDAVGWVAGRASNL